MPGILAPTASGDDLGVNTKLTMVSMMDYQSDFESESDKSEDTLDLINASMRPLLSDNNLTVLESPDVHVHDSRLSFDPIPINHMRKLISDGQTWKIGLPVSKVSTGHM